MCFLGGRCLSPGKFEISCFKSICLLLIIVHYRYFVIDPLDVKDGCIEEIALGFYVTGGKQPTVASQASVKQRFSLTLGEIKVQCAPCYVHTHQLFPIKISSIENVTILLYIYLYYTIVL